MTENDLNYLKSIVEFIQSPCLELGAEEPGLEDESRATHKLLAANDVEHRTTSLEGRVDYIADFEGEVNISERFGSVLCLNTLEHVFDPIRVLDNCISLLRPRGTCVVIAPCVWPLHYYPIDCWRINPGFFTEYVKRRERVTIIEETFRYVSGEPLNGPEYSLPYPSKGFWSFWSRGIHKLFNTHGRGMFFPSQVAVGVVLRVG